MKIETEKGIIINSDQVRYYRYADENGGDDHVGTKADWHIMAFFSKDNFVSLASFERPNYVLNKDGGRRERFNNFMNAFIHQRSFYSFREDLCEFKDQLYFTEPKVNTTGKMMIKRGDKIINADLIQKYQMCDDPGGKEKYAGYSGNVYFVAFFEDGESICLAVGHSSTDATVENQYQKSWKEMKRALKDGTHWFAFDD